MENRVAVAWILIVIGSIILFHQTELIQLNTANIISLLSMGWGIILLLRGWKHPDHKGIFGGTFFTILGISIFLMHYEYFPIADLFALGIILIDLGIAHLVYFAFVKSKISNLVFAVIFILTGLPFMAYEYYYISVWEIRDIFSTFWPILLILVGVGFLGEGLIRHFKKDDHKISKLI